MSSNGWRIWRRRCAHPRPRDASRRGAPTLSTCSFLRSSSRNEGVAKSLVSPNPWCRQVLGVAKSSVSSMARTPCVILRLSRLLPRSPACFATVSFPVGGNGTAGRGGISDPIGAPWVPFRRYARPENDRGRWLGRRVKKGGGSPWRQVRATPHAGIIPGRKRRSRQRGREPCSSAASIDPLPSLRSPGMTKRITTGMAQEEGEFPALSFPAGDGGSHRQEGNPSSDAQP
jgi:hypothetical protein